MIRVGIIGASGYAGAELIRYLLTHPAAEITYMASETYAGKHISEAYPSLIGQDLPLCEAYNVEIAADRADVFFQTNKNGMGMRLAPELLEFGKRMIDVPADFRLKDVSVYKEYYGAEHTAQDLLKEAVYGLSELHPEAIGSARLVANPGCYATSAILALAPLMSEGIARADSIVIDAKSGVSGAGRSKLSVPGLFCEINEGFRAYAVTTHGHTPEIEQELTVLAGSNVVVNFTPHLIPMNRGILTTAYVDGAQGRELPPTSDLVNHYKRYFEGKKFVVVLDVGMQPCTKSVLGTNFCHIAVVSDQRTNRMIVTSAIDNMGKGAAGQAVQNMNLMFGLDETTGLMAPAVYP